MKNEEKLLAVLFGGFNRMEIKAEKEIDGLKKKGMDDIDIAELYVSESFKRIKTLLNLIVLNAPEKIIDNEKKCIKQDIITVAVMAFKNTLQMQYYEKLLVSKGIDFEGLE